jgi:UDP-N-acetylmuramoyl-tripeptide--D-alanyl-D-alanine ligase
MNPFRIEEVLSATRARLHAGDARRLCTGVSTDTRTLSPGELWLALRGPSHDGNRFAREAAERGAAGVVLCAPPGETPAEAAEAARRAPVLLHADPRALLAELGAWHRARIRARVIGVTGSCGKTTTKNVLVELLSSRLVATGSPNSFNNDVGVPLTLFRADDATEALVVEIGTNGPGEIAALARLARPDAGIVTTVGAAHLEGLGSLAGVAEEKGALVEALPADGFCVLNADNPWTPTLRKRARCRVLTFSLNGDGDLDARDVWFHPGGTTFRLAGREITSPLLGLHNVQNLLAALAACRGLGLPIEEVLPAVSRLRAGRGRLDRIACGRYTLIDDSYNANPESARASVRTLAGLHGHRRRVLVLGDMLELGPEAPELHHEIGAEAARAGLDVLVLVGELARAAGAGALSAGLSAERVVHVADTDEAIACVPRVLADGDVVLVKGSRRTGLERLVSALIERERAQGNAA